MTKTATEPAIEIANFGLGQSITDANYASVVQAGHYIWQRTGTIFLAHSFRPLFKIITTTYTQTTTETADYAESLDVLWAEGIALRRVENSGAVATGISIKIVGINISVRLTVYAFGIATTTIIATCGATWETATTSTTIDPASYDYAGENDIYFKIEAKVPVSGTGYLASVMALETIATTAQLPRGR